MLKRRKRPPPRRQGRSPNVISGLIYVVAVIIAIAMGGLFYVGYIKAKKSARAAPSTTVDEYFNRELPPGAKVIAKATPNRPLTPPKTRSTNYLAHAQKNAPTATPAAVAAPSATLEPTATPQPTAQPTAVPSRIPLNPLALYPRSSWQPVASDFPNPLTVTLYPSTNVGYLADSVGTPVVSSELTIQGHSRFILSSFDITPIKGWTIRRATWHGRVAQGRAREFGFSTITANWNPATGEFNGLPIESYPGLPDLFRALDNADYSVTPEESAFRGHGASILFTAQPQPPDNIPGQWVTVDLDPVLLQSLIAGTSQGIAISDEAGQTGQAVSLASDVDNRVYIEVEGGISDVIPPGPIEGFSGDAPRELARSQSVGVVLNWRATGDDDRRGQAFRYDLRYAREDCGFDKATPVSRHRLPFPQPCGQPDRMIVEGLDPMITYHFYLRAVDETGQAGPVTTTRITTGNPWTQPVAPSMEAFDSSPIDVAGGAVSFLVLDEFSSVNPLTGQILSTLKSTPEAGARRSFLWDRTTRTIRTRAVRGETVAFQMLVGRKSPTLPALTLEADALIGAKGNALKTTPAFHRVWYAMGEIGGARAWIGDGLVPLDKPLQMPWPNNAIPNQTFQSVYVECAVPADAEPGFYRGHLFIGSGPGARDTLNLFIEVLNSELQPPDRFVCEWVIPPTLAALYRKDPTQVAEVAALEKEYLRLALEHRSVAGFFPYLPGGACQPPFCPVSGSSGGQCLVESWTDWDVRMEAQQAVTPRRPIILPAFENWPVPFEDGYLCFDQDTRRTDGAPVYAGGLSELESCLHLDYLRTFRSAVRQFGEHLTGKGWKEAPVYVWLNNQPTTNYQGRAPVWSFGAPDAQADFAALALFARLANAETRSMPGPFAFRVSVPRASALREQGGGLFQSLAISDPKPWGWHIIRARAATYGETPVYFSESLPLSGTGLPVEALGLRFYLEGAEGWVIRDVVGRADHWLQAKPFALVYNGMPFGQNKPYPSLRMKALRRALQDIALLDQLAEKKGWTRRQTADFVYTVLGAQKGGGLSAQDWHQLRHAVQQLQLP